MNIFKGGVMIGLEKKLELLPYETPGSLISSWNVMLFQGEESKLGSVKTFCLDIFNSSKMFWPSGILGKILCSSHLFQYWNLFPCIHCNPSSQFPTLDQLLSILHIPLNKFLQLHSSPSGLPGTGNIWENLTHNTRQKILKQVNIVVVF